MKIVSTTWPWDHDKLSVKQTVEHLEALKAEEVCIRTPEYFKPYNPSWNECLADAVQGRGIDVSIWPIVSLYDPKAMAKSILDEVARYRPSRVILDAERRWVVNYGGNTKLFLESLGRISCPVGLASYRRASAWPQILWQTWWTTKVGGEYVIDFNASQLYPIGWMRPASWVYQFKLDVDSHEAQHVRAGRPNISWLPFMPAFVEGLDPYGKPWYPRVEPTRAAVAYMRGRLGARLLGLNWWSLDQDMVLAGPTVAPRMEPLYEYIKSI